MYIDAQNTNLSSPTPCSMVNGSQIGSMTWSWHIRPQSGLQTLVWHSKGARYKAKRQVAVSHGLSAGREGMASPVRAHPAALEEAGQAGRGQPGTVWSPCHQASPCMMRQVQGQAGKLVHGSGSVRASAGSAAKHGHGCDAAAI